MASKNEILDKIRPYLGSLGCPKNFGPFWGKKGPRDPKIKIFKKWNKKQQLFTQATSNVSNFNMIRRFLGSLSLPQILGHTDRQTVCVSVYTYIDLPEIVGLAQLKLRKIKYKILGTACFFRVIWDIQSLLLFLRLWNIPHSVREI